MMSTELTDEKKTSSVVLNCPFCVIDERTTVIVENKELVYITLSNPRLVRGHLLIVPKRHIEKLAELSREERDALWDTVVEYQERIVSTVSTGCDIRQNYHPFQRQGRIKVDHLHIHLIPREFKDKIYQITQVYETELFKDLDEEEKRSVPLLFRKG